MTLAELVFFFPVFYIQLYAIKHSLDPTFAFYTVRLPTSSEFHPVVYPVGTCLSADFHIEWQLLLWTTYSGLFAGRLGIANMFIGSSLTITTLIFCMLVVGNVASTAIFSVLYGFFSGTCESL